MNKRRIVAAADNGDTKEEEVVEIFGRQIQQTLAAVKEWWAEKEQVMWRNVACLFL